MKHQSFNRGSPSSVWCSIQHLALSAVDILLINTWMDGWMDQWINRWMDGWMDVRLKGIHLRLD